MSKLNRLNIVYSNIQSFTNEHLKRHDSRKITFLIRLIKRLYTYIVTITYYA